MKMSESETEELQSLERSLLDVSKTEEVDRGYVCTTCGKKFKHYCNLARHMHSHQENTICCKSCTQYFKSKEELDAHLAIKHVPVVCEICGKKFEKKNSLNQHLRLHSSSGVGQITCPYDGCGKRFCKQTQYEDHLNVHTGLQPYTCNNCLAKFKGRYEKNIHERVCNGEVEFRCFECDKVFRHRASLHNHKKSVHAGKGYTCGCGSKFAYRSGLRRHQVEKNHHRYT